MIPNRFCCIKQKTDGENYSSDLQDKLIKRRNRIKGEVKEIKKYNDTKSLF